LPAIAAVDVRLRPRPAMNKRHRGPQLALGPLDDRDRSWVHSSRRSGVGSLASTGGRSTRRSLHPLGLPSLDQSLSFGHQILPAEVAVELADRLFRLFTEPRRCFTNTAESCHSSARTALGSGPSSGPHAHSLRQTRGSRNCQAATPGPKADLNGPPHVARSGPAAAPR